MSSQTMSDQDLLREISFSSNAISIYQPYLELHKAQYHSLMASLEERTRPTVSPVRTFQRIRMGYEFMGEFVACLSVIEIYRQLMSQLWTSFPAARDDIAKELAGLGRNRRYVSQLRDQLFTDKSPQWVRDYSTGLPDGWYLDTNLNRASIRRFLKVAVRVAGLKWDNDVKVNWRSQTLFVSQETPNAGQ